MRVTGWFRAWVWSRDRGVRFFVVVTGRLRAGLFLPPPLTLSVTPAFVLPTSKENAAVFEWVRGLGVAGRRKGMYRAVGLYMLQFMSMGLGLGSLGLGPRVSSASREEIYWGRDRAAGRTARRRMARRRG